MNDRACANLVKFLRRPAREDGKRERVRVHA